jgi:hypothetical protein
MPQVIGDIRIELPDIRKIIREAMQLEVEEIREIVRDEIEIYMKNIHLVSRRNQ